MEHYGTPSGTTTPSRAAGKPRSAPVRAGANETIIGHGRHWLHLMLAVSMGVVWYDHGAASCENRMQIRPRGDICPRYISIRPSVKLPFAGNI